MNRRFQKKDFISSITQKPAMRSNLCVKYYYYWRELILYLKISNMKLFAN